MEIALSSNDKAREMHAPTSDVRELYIHNILQVLGLEGC